MVWLLNSQRTKHCKSAESFCLKILFTQMIVPFTFWQLLLPITFFSARFLNMCKPRTTPYLMWQVSPPGLAFYGSGPAHLSSSLGMMSAGCFASLPSEMFLQIKLISFQGCPTKQAAFLHGQSAPHNPF